jgi:hypothetical protein
MSRPRGTGRIYNQKQSSILWIQYYRDGKMHRESTGTADKRKATRVLSRRLAEISTGSFTAPDVARIRISELAEDFLRDYRINGRSSIDDAEARWRLSEPSGRRSCLGECEMRLASSRTRLSRIRQRRA